MNFQMFKMDLEKAEERYIKLPTTTGSLKKRVPEKSSTSALLVMPKPGMEKQTVEKPSRDENTRPPDLPPEKSVCKSRSNS